MLVTGDWGTGKTFQIKRALREDERYYVSLFGLQSADDVYSEVFSTMSPLMSGTKKAFGWLEETLKGLEGAPALTSFVPGVWKATIRQEVKTDRVLVFDDLERSNLEPKEMLGIINKYVEHHGCQVIVMTHENKLDDYFCEAKEKIFGQTIKIKPEIDDAFECFCLKFGDHHRALIQSYESTIVSIFCESGVRSLRILQQVIHDISRLLRSLGDDHLKHEAAIRDLLELFCALNLEVRSQNLAENDLRNRKNSSYEYLIMNSTNEKTDVLEPPICTSDNKYETVDLTNELLQDDALISMLICGQYDQILIRKSLNDSHYFLPPDSSPPWKIVLQFETIDDEIVERAGEEIERQFDRREITSPGEMLHIFALLLMMSRKKILKKDLEEILSECKVYIDELLEADRLPAAAMDTFSEDLDLGYDGLGYWGASEKEFKEIFRYLRVSRTKAMEKRLPSIAQDLLGHFNNTPQLFVEAVSFTVSGHNPYHLTPILRFIEPKDFTNAWISSSKSNRRTIMRAIDARYDGGRLKKELAGEAEWVRKVGKLLLEEAKAAEKFSRFAAASIRSSIPSVMLPKND